MVTASPVPAARPGAGARLAAWLSRWRSWTPIGRKLEFITVLNRLGEELALRSSSRDVFPAITAQIRRILNLTGVELWSIDPDRHLLTREGAAWAEGVSLAQPDIDDRLARWQEVHRRLILAGPERRPPLPAPDLEGLDHHVLSLPIISASNVMRGVLNLYSSSGKQWLFRPHHASETREFMRSVGGQLAIFFERRALETSSTLLKEVHHRIKNNLQTVAGLLNMQRRRIDQIGAEQALEESVNRIMSIAIVHETLSQADVGVVDLGEMLGRVAQLTAKDADLVIDLTGERLVMPSREATFLALVVNELVQNAMEHGLGPEGRGTIRITGLRTDHHLHLTVEDDGKGLPEGFDPRASGNLGLEIVDSLITEELRGTFEIEGLETGTAARFVVPFPDLKREPAG